MRGRHEARLGIWATLGRFWFISLASVTVGLSVATAQTSGDQSRSSDQTQSNALQEIVITARLFKENLQNTPVAVTALSAVDLANDRVLDISNLAGLVPNLFIQNGNSTQGPNTSFIIMRGVGLGSPLEPAAGVFLDGVYMPSNSWQTGFVDLQQVQVLRGPQGALFGRNTEAGAVNLVSKLPESQFAGNATLDYGSFGTLLGNAYVTGPITKTLLFSLGAQATQTNGYTKNVYNNTNIDGHEVSSLRGALEWLPSDDLSLIARGDWEGYRGGTGSLVGQVLDSPDPVNQPGQWQVAAPFDPYEISSSYGESLTVNYSGSPVTFTSITAYRYEHYLYQMNDDGFVSPNYGGGQTPNITPSIYKTQEFPVPSGYGDLDINDSRQTILSEELRLNSNPSEEFRWLVGAYGYHEMNDLAFYRALPNPNPFIANPVNFVNQSRNDLSSTGFAVFGEVRYYITKSMELSVGGRYSDDHISQDAALRYNIADFLVGNFGLTPSVTFVGVTPLGTITYHWTDALMTYVSVGQGYKEGGLPLAIPAEQAANLPFRSERSTNYEIGAKTDWLENRLSADLTLYNVEVKDAQVFTLVEIAGIPTPATTNAGSTRSQGVEFELAAKPVAPLTLTTAWGYINARYVSYSPSPGVSDAGVKLQGLPDWTGSVGGTWVQSIASTRMLAFHIDYRHIGEKVSGAGTPISPYVPTQGYSLLNADISLLPSNAQWKATLYVNNVFNAYTLYSKAINVSNGLNNPIEAPAYQVPANPSRAFGIRASYSF